MDEVRLRLHETAYAASPVVVELAQEIAARGAMIEALKAENARFRDELAALKEQVLKLKTANDEATSEGPAAQEAPHD